MRFYRFEEKERTEQFVGNSVGNLAGSEAERGGDELVGGGGGPVLTSEAERGWFRRRWSPAVDEFEAALSNVDAHCTSSEARKVIAQPRHTKRGVLLLVDPLIVWDQVVNHGRVCLSEFV